MENHIRNKIIAMEVKLGEIDNQIADLRAKREAVLLSDEEYAGYVEHYQAYYEDEPLSIRRYYESSEELERINNEIMAADDEQFEALWRRYTNRIARLERLLAA